MAQAQEFIARLVPRVTAVEMKPIRDALGRVLARDIVSAIDVPAHDNSAMDGFALRGSELQAAGDTRCASSAAAWPGRTSSGTVPAGGCVRITTGAVMPAGLDTVVPQEFTQTEGDTLIVPPGVLRSRRQPAPGRRRPGPRRAGPERRPPAAPGRPGLLASLGQAEVPVLRRLRVAFFSTGDELRSIGEPLDAGCVYDSNRYTIWAMLQRLGVEAIDLGVVRDDPAALAEAFTQAAGLRRRRHHLGRRQRRRGRPHQEDHGRAGRGAVLAHRDAPGAADGDRPHRRQRGNQAILFGLPGNPVAVMVTFYAFVREALLRMAGATPAADAAAACRLRRAAAQEAGAHRVPARHRHAARPTGNGRCASPARRARASCAA